ncbi:MAG: DUF3786 domain-containing protein [Desulfobacteraceae bacterium]|nr:MAG: DUF3786 domain-containing protein [Desulfobacteraceae bacterium]
MPLSVLDLYRKFLPKTNCRDCGYQSCLAFAGMVVSEGLPVETCPHIVPELIASIRKEMEAQRKSRKWTRRDPAEDALQWASERAAPMKIKDLSERIGGRLVEIESEVGLELPYFLDTLIIFSGRIAKSGGDPLNHWEQVFIFNHMAMGGSREPTGKWKGLVELPNTVSKIKTMKGNVERPLVDFFRGRPEKLLKAALALGGQPAKTDDSGADVAILFRPLPRIPMLLLFRDEDEEEAYEAEASILFDETIVEHLDIESILFLSERLKQLLCGESL